MATGDVKDVFGRINSYLPSRWFTGLTPVKDAVVIGIATVLSQIYALYLYAKLQTRIATATDAWLDLISADFFGATFPRNSGESDASFRARIQANLFMPRTSRPAMVTVLTKLTGRAPSIFEPNNPFDTGALSAPGSRGYCGVARMGSMAVPYNALIVAYRPVVTGQVSAGAAFMRTPTLSALSTPLSQGYTGSLALSQASVSDSAIYAAINATRPIATVIGVVISS